MDGFDDLNKVIMKLLQLSTHNRKSLIPYANGTQGQWYQQ